MSEWRALDVPACRLGESLVWDDEQGALLWVDIPRGLVFRGHPERSRVVAEAVLGEPVGAVVPATAGALVVASQSGFSAIVPGNGVVRLADVEVQRSDTRMNDGACDSRGRFWAGTMSTRGRRAQGSLYRLDPDLAVTRVLSGVSVSNGIGWSPDSGVMYYIDTPTGRVDAFDFDADTGSLDNRRVFAAIPERCGRPDGLTVDADGCVWVALWDGAAVWRLAPDGQVAEQLALPVARVTTCAFGGPDLRDLYVASAEDDHPGNSLAGRIFCLPDAGQGLPPHRFAGLL